MNAATELVDTVQSGEEPTRREGLVFADNLLGAILEADDTIYNTLTEDQRASVDGEVLDPLAYVDASIVDKLMELDVAMDMEFEKSEPVRPISRCLARRTVRSASCPQDVEGSRTLRVVRGRNGRRHPTCSHGSSVPWRTPSPSNSVSRP